MKASEYMERALGQEWHGTLGRREQEPPDAEETVRASARYFRASDHENFDAAVDDLLDGDDPFSDDLPLVRRPSRTVAGGSATATGSRPSSREPVAPSSNEQHPGRGHARGA